MLLSGGVDGAEPRRTTPWREEGTRERGVVAWLRPARRRVLVGLLLAALALNWYFGSKVTEKDQPADVPYTVFRAQVKDGNVVRVNAIGDDIEGVFRSPISFPGGSSGSIRKFQTLRPTFDDTHLLTLLEKNGVQVTADRPEARPLWQILLLSFGPTLLLVALLVWLFRRAGAFRSLSIGKSSATRYEADDGRATFDDVAGIEESKAELVEIVDFLSDPERYWRLGAAIPRGVLLSGRPAPARRCWRAQSRGRRTCPSTRSPAPSSSRWSSASARAGCATCSSRRRRTLRRSSSSTSSTQLGGLAATLSSARATRSVSRRSTRSSPRWMGSRATTG